MSDPPPQQPYTPGFVEAELRRAGRIRAIRRILQVAFVLLQVLLWRRLDRWSWTYGKGETVESRQRRRAEWLLDRIVWLGPAFVKVGQSLATRPDLLPLTYIQVLAQLYDRLPPYPDELAFAVIERELGWKPYTLFQSLEREPFAAASLGQVYRGVTHTGTAVAVKVQRPDMERIISIDLALVRRIAALLEQSPKLGRGQPWISLVDEFGTKLFEELDYVHEAHLTERFRRNVAGLPGIYAPQVHWDLTSRRVLTTEFIAGIRITDKKALLEAGLDIREILGQGIRANLKQLFEDGFFHADPHPGNLLVRPQDGTLVFLDFGMMGIIRPDQRERIVEIFVDVINRRPDKLRANLVALGCLQPDGPWDQIVPHAEEMFRALFGDQERRHSFEEVTSRFAPLVYQFKFRIPLDFAYIVRAIMMLEGISRQLDPDFDIFAVSAPYAARMLVTSPRPSLRQRLMDELIAEDGGLNWTRLNHLASLASRDGGSHRQAQGLLDPALDMLLSHEGAPLRRALVNELLSSRGPAAEQKLEGVATLLASDPDLSGRAILDRLVAFLLSTEGAETRAQIRLGLRLGGSGRLDLAGALSLASRARRLHPDFRARDLFSSVVGYLLSERGHSARHGLLEAVQRSLALAPRGRMSRGIQPAPSIPADLVAQPE